MERLCAKLSSLRYLKFLCIFLLFVNSVVSQINEHGVGIPLPVIKEGQSAVHSSFQPNLQNRNSHRFIDTLGGRPNINFQDKSINLSSGSSHGGSVGNSNLISRRGGSGPGSLQHIQEPSVDENVRSLLNHPLILKKIQKETLADSAVKIDSVITAHRQTVSGQITYLGLKVVETQCSIGAINLHACAVDVSEDPYVCEVAVWQRPWLNSTKIIDEKTKCAEVESDNDFKNWNKGNGILRAATRDQIVLNALPNYLDENQVALEAFDYVNRGSESKFKGQMINHHVGPIVHDSLRNVTIVDVRVEYGFTLCLNFPDKKVDERVCPLDVQRDNYICSVKVISDPNLTTNLKVLPDNDDDDIDCEKRRAVEEELVVPVKALCLGCPQTVSLNDPSILSIAEFAIIEYDRTSDENELHALLKIHKAQTQVVNGIKYFLTLELADTDCRKPLSAVNMNRTLCNHDLTEESDICEIVVLEQPWQKSREVLSARCFDKHEYPSSHRDEFIVPVLSGGSFMATSAVHTGSASASQQAQPFDIRKMPISMQNTISFVVDEVNRREVDDHDDGYYKIRNVIETSTSNEPLGRVDLVVLELGETICTTKDAGGNCPFKLGEESEICTAKVLKGPSNGQSPSNRLVLLKCDDSDDHRFLASSPSTITPYSKVNRPFFNLEPASLGLPGGPRQQPTNSSTTMDIAHFVVEQYNLQSDEDELYKLGNVISSFSQMKGSVYYTLELELLETECKKYQPVLDVSRCPVDRKEDPEICQAEVHLNFSVDGTKSIKQLTRIFCAEREDFYVKKLSNLASGTASTWNPEDSSSGKMQELGKLVANEFDSRSDEDNIFVLFKVLEAHARRPGLTHHLKVELAETVCPKYKQRINKTRCAIDIGEDHKLCEADLTERPWRNDYEITNLRCNERDDSKEDLESREILYPRIHPSAHARPQFIASTYKIRQQSQESDESNERYYQVGGLHRHGGEDTDEIVDGDRISIGPEGRFEKVVDKFEVSDDRFETEDDEEDRDSEHRHDNDSKSNEGRSLFRFRRGVRKISKRSPAKSLLGSATAVEVNDSDVQELASFGVKQVDQLSEDPRLRKVVEVLQASRKVVAGWEWNLKTKVSYTHCLKGSVSEQPNLSTCEVDQNEPSYICTMTIWEKPWESGVNKKVTNSECVPESS